MVECSSAAKAGDAAAPHELEVAWISLEYVRDTILISRGDGDLVDALIFTVALDANMVPVDRAPDLGRIYGGVDTSAPDELRRPVSMHAVAQSLGLPFETVRRRFAGLIDSGACIMTAQGVVVPRGAVTSSAYKAIQRARYDRARQLHQALRSKDALPELNVGPPPGEPPVRAANRALSEYMLRACRRLFALTGDVVTTLVLMQLLLENTSGMRGEQLAHWMRDPAATCRPVRIPRLAEGLPFSRETVRRHILGLTDLGFCQRVAGGLAAVAPPAARPRLARLFSTNKADLRRLFHRLASLDVLADWDAEAGF